MASAFTVRYLQDVLPQSYIQLLEWDASAGRITNYASLNRYLASFAREGWRV